MHDVLWKFYSLNFNEHKNRILITCTLLCVEWKEKGERNNFRKETKETTNLIKMHYASNPGTHVAELGILLCSASQANFAVEFQQDDRAIWNFSR